MIGKLVVWKKLKSSSEKSLNQKHRYPALRCKPSVLICSWHSTSGPHNFLLRAAFCEHTVWIAPLHGSRATGTSTRDYALSAGFDYFEGCRGHPLRAKTQLQQIYTGVHWDVAKPPGLAAHTGVHLDVAKPQGHAALPYRS